MRIGFHRGEIVDPDHLDVLAIGFGDGAQHVAANAPKAVDGDTNCHARLLRSPSSAPLRRKARFGWAQQVNQYLCGAVPSLLSLSNAALATASAVMPKCL